MLADGYWQGASTLVAGPSGSGKTLMGLHFIFNGAAAGQPGIIATLQENATQLDRIAAASVTGVVRGHLDLPSLARSTSPSLSRLYTMGRLTQLSYGDTAVGSVAISEDFHPFDTEGRLQSHLSLLGVLTGPLTLKSDALTGKTLVGVVEGDATPQEFIPRLISLWSAGQLPIERLIEQLPLDAINEAEQASLSGRVVKPVLVP